jgi:hypothetical protein
MFNYLKKLFGRHNESIQVADSLIGKTKSNKKEVNFSKLFSLYDINYCLGWIHSENKCLRNNAISTIKRIFNIHRKKNINYFQNNTKNVFIRRSDLRLYLQFESEFSLILFCVASVNSNGYIREEALNYLIKKMNAVSFPFVFYRLNDWVPEVKLIAERAIIHQLPGISDLLIKNHKLVDWLKKVKRNDLTSLHKKILSSLFKDDKIAPLVGSLKKYDSGQRFYILRHIIANKHIIKSHLLDIVNDKYYLIRLMIIKNINLENNQVVFKKLLADKSTKVRAYTINKIKHTNVEEFFIEIQTLLSDDALNIRERSRKLIASHQATDFHEYYKNEIKNNIKVGNILGIAEVGTKKDIDLLTHILENSTGRKKAACLQSISILDYKQAQNISFIHIFDRSISVKKSCAEIIPRNLELSALTKIRKNYKTCDDQTKYYLLKIISQYRRWDVLGDFFIGAQEQNKMLKDYSVICIRRWNDYSTKLGISKTQQDKDYVLLNYHAYKASLANDDEEIDDILNKIPFVFK